MSPSIDILTIDDDKFVHKMIARALQSKDISVRTALNGELGIEAVSEQPPNIILLDVEMPGMNGYEVCNQLRMLEASKNTPIVFLSSHGSLQERMQGYEAGADDYLIKPFEAEYLQVRINTLIKYQQEREALRAQYEIAQKSASMAMTSTSELALAMRFLEKSLSYQDIDNLITDLLSSIDQYSLHSCAMVTINEQLYWYSSNGSASISPLEKELIEMCDKNSRFLDFGIRTIINYPQISLLVKNMPINDMDRYGRIKDLLPMILSAANTKISALITHEALTQQSLNLIDSFRQIRNSLYYLGSTIVNNRRDSENIMKNLIDELNCDFLRMGLEEDQEEYLLTRVDDSLHEALEEMDAGKEIRQALTFILANLKTIIEKQDELVDAFTNSLANESVNQEDDLGDDVELF